MLDLHYIHKIFRSITVISSCHKNDKCWRIITNYNEKQIFHRFTMKTSNEKNSKGNVVHTICRNFWDIVLDQYWFSFLWYCSSFHLYFRLLANTFPSINHYMSEWFTMKSSKKKCRHKNKIKKCHCRKCFQAILITFTHTHTAGIRYSRTNIDHPHVFKLSYDHFRYFSFRPF